MRRTDIKLKKWDIKQEIKWFLFMLPIMLTMAVFIYYPFLQDVFKSFFYIPEVNELHMSNFVGLNNYVQVFKDPRFLHALYITFILMLMSLVFIPIGFIIAFMINNVSNKKLQAVFRISFFFPYVIPYVAIILIFQVFLQQSGGVLNAWLSVISGHDVAIGWLGDPRFARIGVSIILNYSKLPYGIIICLAGLQAIPNEIYESADIDGANVFQKLLRITVPNMRGIFTFLFISQVIFGFQRITDLIINGLGHPTGAPAGSLQSIMMLIFELSFFRTVSVAPNYGYVYAMNIVLAGIILLVTICNIKATKVTK